MNECRCHCAGIAAPYIVMLMHFVRTIDRRSSGPPRIGLPGSGKKDASRARLFNYGPDYATDKSDMRAAREELTYNAPTTRRCLNKRGVIKRKV